MFPLGTIVQLAIGSLRYALGGANSPMRSIFVTAEEESQTWMLKDVRNTVIIWHFCLLSKYQCNEHYILLIAPHRSDVFVGCYICFLSGSLSRIFHLRHDLFAKCLFLFPFFFLFFVSFVFVFISTALSPQPSVKH